MPKSGFAKLHGQPGIGRRRDKDPLQVLSFAPDQGRESAYRGMLRPSCDRCIGKGRPNARTTGCISPDGRWQRGGRVDSELTRPKRHDHLPGQRLDRVRIWNASIDHPWRHGHEFTG